MATYNGARFIREQVDSILNQEFKENPCIEMELIVSDDGSTDGTIDILENYHDDRIKVFHHDRCRSYKYLNANRKCMRNFENAMMNAKGDYIFLSDQDDVWYPWKIDKSVSMLRKVGGVSNARNIGMKEASGEWITFIDADDRIAPDHLQKYADAVASVPAYTFPMVYYYCLCTAILV